MEGVMKLNADMGESFGAWTMGMDSALMPWIDMANIACGFHASDPDVMAATVALAVKHNVSIGAHPGYADKQGFGRRHIDHTPAQISHLVRYQIGALQGICARFNASLDYVKPHGALYNTMMVDNDCFEAVLAAVADTLPNTPLMVLALPDNRQHRQLAQRAGVPLIFEAFADRAYLASGQLAPRDQPGAVLDDANAMIAQVLQLSQHGTVTTLEGQTLSLSPDTVCVHGDNLQSVEAIKQLRKALTP
ncbi:5-oxoprolinase subunit PxpA [Salinivibrio sp. YCSC6]|uniref:5-oxoprolinase subunit PxpA n=2 Tax=Salinivibrio sp. YCSC6 TaxID=2003370 RepID=UPI000BBBAF7F|nr:5-oxoprolinase subunit PxpA [Salinivibrio sp. YCSC6]QCF37741.1 5-oxoprolinase subunit PxpA [Salinivibrio sp. YCSC6]